MTARLFDILNLRESEGAFRGALFLLPLWEKVARTKSAKDEGLYPRAQRAVYRTERNPSPGSHLAMRSDLSHKGRDDRRCGIDST